MKVKESAGEFFRRFFNMMNSRSCFTMTIQDRTVLIINRRLILYEDFMAKLKDFMSQTNTFTIIFRTRLFIRLFLFLKNMTQRIHTSLYETLREYLECERNYVRTAERLFIHRNTLLYRLKRINDLTNLDLDDADVRLHIQLSYRLITVTAC